MVYRLDVYVGQIIQKLKDKGLYDNTIIIFASDNGPHMEGAPIPISSTATAFIADINGICTKAVSVSR